MALPVWIGLKVRKILRTDSWEDDDAVYKYSNVCQGMLKCIGVYICQRLKYAVFKKEYAYFFIPTHLFCDVLLTALPVTCSYAVLAQR